MEARQRRGDAGVLSLRGIFALCGAIEAGRRTGFCGPSDYIKINENCDIYTRTECELSGTFTAYVMDLNRVEQIGVRLGFDASDALEYYVFRGKGEWLGQLAQFEKFGDESGNPVPAAAAGQTPAKGARRVYRPFETMAKMTSAQVDAVCAKIRQPSRRAPSRPAPTHRPHQWLAISGRTPIGLSERVSLFATIMHPQWNTVRRRGNAAMAQRRPEQLDQGALSGLSRCRSDPVRPSAGRRAES